MNCGMIMDLCEVYPMEKMSIIKPEPLSGEDQEQMRNTPFFNTFTRGQNSSLPTLLALKPLYMGKKNINTN